MKYKKLPDAELEIMLVLWENDSAENSEHIMEKLDKQWAKPTLFKLLSRLEKRGFVHCEKSGRYNMYTPIVKKDDYLLRETGGFLKKMYHGSITSLVAALYDGDGISKEDLDELEEYIRSAK